MVKVQYTMEYVPIIYKTFRKEKKCVSSSEGLSYLYYDTKYTYTN